MNVQAQYTYTALSVPGASSTAAYGISGTNISGFYESGYYYGFVYNGRTYTTLSVPGADDTYAEGISGNTIVGAYATSGSIGAPTQAFLYNTNSGNYTTLSIQGATTSFAYGVSGNSIVGGYDTSTGDYGFLATAVLPLNLMSAVGGGQFHLIVSGSTSSTIVQASTNMLSWVPVYTNTPPFTFTDTTMTLLPCRFYRALASQ